MSHSSTALHVTTPKVSTSQMILRPTYPYSAPKCKKNKIWSRFNSILHCQKVLGLLFHVLLSYMLNVVVIGCLTLLYCAFQPVIAFINHLLTYLLTY